MARVLERLTARQVTALMKDKAAGVWLHADGNNLYLQVCAYPARSWVFKYRAPNHKYPREMGLGSALAVDLDTARAAALRYCALLREGIDPIEHRRAERSKAALAAASTVSFEQCAEECIAAKGPGWKNAKHAAQWSNTLKNYVYPIFGHVPVALVDVALILKALRPIWTSIPETASRVRMRIETVLDFATGPYRTGPNPARWKESLKSKLPALADVNTAKHFPALPYSEIWNFVRELGAMSGVAALSLEFIILTATRTSDVRLAKWSEIDFESRIWTIPGDRLKGRKRDKRPDHRVPLSSRALDVLSKVRSISNGGEYIFPGPKPEKPQSNGAMLALLDRMGRGDITTHGFRSTFRDWAAEQTNYPREVCEMALAHTIDDKVEAAYRRGELLKKRTNLMRDWARYVSTPTAAVIEIARERGAA